MKTPSKKAAPTPTSRPVGAAQILASLIAADDTDLQRMLLQAERELPAQFEDRFEAGRDSDAARRLVKQAEKSRAAARVDALKANDQHDALCDLEWMSADAGFPLGLLSGLRLVFVAGGAR